MNNQFVAVVLNKLTKSWIKTASATDITLVTVTKAGEKGKNHIVTGVNASVNAGVTRLLTIKDGSSVIFEHYIYGSDALNSYKETKGNSLNIKITKGNPVTVELEAPGLGNTGKVNIMGFTV
jgi:hypothetical protein